MHFLQVNVKFNDAINMIRDVISTPTPFPYTMIVMFVGVINNKSSQTLKDR